MSTGGEERGGQLLEVQAGTLAPRPSWAAAWLDLAKGRIAAMVVLSALMGAVLSAPEGLTWRTASAALLVGLVAASSAMFNHVLERDTDRLMNRTRHRPLVTGQVRVRDALVVATILGSLGTLVLALEFNLLSALLALASLVAYALVYTPFKRVSTLNTIVGAVPGAMPPLIASAAVAGAPTHWGLALFALIFCWQFPHFMAIAWLHREDYARAGMKMLPAMPDSQGVAGRQALLYALCSLPLSLLPTLSGDAGLFYAVAALGCGLCYVGAAWRFSLREDRPRARALLLVSLVYLPFMYGAILLDPIVRRSFHG
ncbi:MAG: protoheme IX farnesyltransferase [Planctomycetes bacterium]|nr:protoheme IX farnesyltransferase [Planctomycetota bacterium]